MRRRVAVLSHDSRSARGLPGGELSAGAVLAIEAGIRAQVLDQRRQRGRVLVGLPGVPVRYAVGSKVTPTGTSTPPDSCHLRPIDSYISTVCRRQVGRSGPPGRPAIA